MTNSDEIEVFCFSSSNRLESFHRLYFFWFFLVFFAQGNFGPPGIQGPMGPPGLGLQGEKVKKKKFRIKIKTFLC